MPFLRPPRGYRQMEHPLPHKFDYNFALDFLDTTKDATMLTLFRTTEDALGAETIEVNPSHPNFVEDTGPTILNGSIIPKVNVTMKMNLSQATLLDNEFGSVVVNVLPIYIAFESTLVAQNVGPPETEIEDIVELSHNTTLKKTNVLWANVKLSAGTHPLSTITNADTISDWNLTTNSTMESVAFSPGELYDAFRYYTNAGMLRKVTGRRRSFVLSRDRTAHLYSNNFTNPSVKRGNSYTFCGMLVWVTTPGATGSYGVATDFDAADKDIINFNTRITFDEWNVDFDQTAF